MTKPKELVSYSWKPLSPEASTFPHTHTHNIVCELQEPSTHSRTNKPFNIQQTEVSHVQLPTVGEKYHANHDDNTLQKLVYGPMYVPYNEDGQKLLLLQTTDMSRKDNLKFLYNSLPEGMCNNEYESLEQAVNDV